MRPPPPSDTARPVALVTGVGRRAGIGAAVTKRLAADGFDVASTHWDAYDERMSWGADPRTGRVLAGAVAEAGGRHVAIDADLEHPDAAARLFEAVAEALALPQVLVMCHCESVDSGILDTTIEGFDRHVAVNARATWLLIREFARRYRAPHGAGRLIALTSDHTVGNLAYGASKAALDRITLAAAHELAELGVTANVINPGPTDTGWMTRAQKESVIDQTPLGRVGGPDDVANLVSFLCSADGGWINAQLLYSNGGIASP